MTTTCRSQRRRLLLPALLLAPLAAGAQTASADGRVIRVVVPWNAGGGTDVATRAIVTALTGTLQQQVVVENKPGANGMIGTESVAHARPDGLTLGIASVETHSVNPHVYRKLPYRPIDDFTPVAMLCEFPYALVVRQSLDAKDLAGFAAAARARPGVMTFASWGVGSSSQIAFELLRQTAKLDMLHVPFTGAAPALQAVVAGQVDAVMVPLSIAEPQWRAGKARLLGLGSTRRAAITPELPTLIEQGVDAVGGTWLAMVGPAGIPAATVERLNRAVNAALATAELRQTLERMGVQPQTGTPAALGDTLRTELTRWGAVVKTAGISLD
ncbi:MAG TPA: tripartite tricarboxylate transporter substrate binding protein [Burkholderiaceae bacterium]|nr:tripartite tricarboxylate transporter substrate binding protein [Burkholderiaceae bacterium]